MRINTSSIPQFKSSPSYVSTKRNVASNVVDTKSVPECFYSVLCSYTTPEEIQKTRKRTKEI